MFRTDENWTASEVSKLARLLTRRAEHLESTLNHIPIGIASIEGGGVLVYANRAFRRQHLNLPKLAAAVRTHVQATSGCPECIIITIADSTVRIYPQEDGALTLLSSDASLPVAAEEKFAALERLSGRVAHRLNNLLTVVLSGTEMLQADLGTVGSFGSELAQIREATVSAARILQDLLTYSRGRPMSTVAIDVDQAVRNMSSLLSKVAGNCDLRLEVNASGAQVQMGDRDLETVLLNLVRNSAESVGDAGGIIVVQTHKEGDNVSIAITDTGCGIPPQVAGLLFEPFVTTKPGAAGMGLAVVFGIVKRAGGDIRISAAPGGGTQVSVVIPVTG